MSIRRLAVACESTGGVEVEVVRKAWCSLATIQLVAPYNVREAVYRRGRKSVRALAFIAVRIRPNEGGYCGSICFSPELMNWST